MYDPLYWMVPINHKSNGNFHESLWTYLMLILGKYKIHRFGVGISEDA